MKITAIFLIPLLLLGILGCSSTSSGSLAGVAIAKGTPVALQGTLNDQERLFLPDLVAVLEKRGFSVMKDDKSQYSVQITFSSTSAFNVYCTIVLQKDGVPITDWITTSVVVPFASQPIGVCLAGEEESSGPSNDALVAYDWLSSHWPEAFRLIEDQAFEFYVPYRDAVSSVPHFASPGDLLGTEEVSSVRVRSKDSFQISLRFAWQETEDPHLVTFYIEEGSCRSHSVDG